MADIFGVQQPPTKKFRSGTNSTESGKSNIYCKLFICIFVLLDFDFKMMSQYDTPDTNNTQDTFDIGHDFSDTLESVQQQQISTSSTSIQSTVPSSSSPILNQQSTNIYQQQTQPRLTFIPQTRAQLPSYQTPNLQRIQTMPQTSTIVRPPNVISNGIQQQPTIYTQQQQMMNQSGGINRPLYQRMPTATTQPQNISSTIVRQPYNTTGMININQNVPQMSIVKVSARYTNENFQWNVSFFFIQASDPNNNNVFVTTSQQQQQSTLLGLQQTVTQTPTVQTNKPITTGLPSLTAQQINQFQTSQQQILIQQQNPVQSYNNTPMRVCIKKIIQIQ